MPTTCVLKLQTLVADEELVPTVPSCSCCLLTCNTSFAEAPFPVQNAHFPLLAIYKYTFLQNKSTLTLVKVPLRITGARPPLPASSAHAAIGCGDSSTLLEIAMRRERPIGLQWSTKCDTKKRNWDSLITKTIHHWTQCIRTVEVVRGSFIGRKLVDEGVLVTDV